MTIKEFVEVIRSDLKIDLISHDASYTLTRYSQLEMQTFGNIVIESLQFTSIDGKVYAEITPKTVIVTEG